jgi:hypothetical protein
MDLDAEAALVSRWERRCIELLLLANRLPWWRPFQYWLFVREADTYERCAIELQRFRANVQGRPIPPENRKLREGDWPTR